MRLLLIILLLPVTILSCNDKYTVIPEWSSVGDFPGVGRQHAVVFNTNDKVYVGLGDDGNTNFNDLWEFDPINNAWSRKADFPGNVREPVYFSTPDLGYVMSGNCGCKDFWSYNAETNTWNKRADCPVSGLYHAAVFMLGKYAYIGTGRQNGSLQKNIWRYDWIYDQWAQMKDFPGTPVEQAAGFSLSGKGYIATGNKAAGKSNEMWQYDPDTDSWIRKADFPNEVAGCLAFGFDSESRAFIGLGDLGSEFWEYLPYDNKWNKSNDFTGGSRKGAITYEIFGKRYVGLGALTTTQYPKDMWELTLRHKY